MPQVISQNDARKLVIYIKKLVLWFVCLVVLLFSIIGLICFSPFIEKYAPIIIITSSVLYLVTYTISVIYALKVQRQLNALGLHKGGTILIVVEALFFVLLFPISWAVPLRVLTDAKKAKKVYLDEPVKDDKLSKERKRLQDSRKRPMLAFVYRKCLILSIPIFGSIRISQRDFGLFLRSCVSPWGGIPVH